ncbi:DJ-1/PfpI family protein [Methanoculleus bourgensis]|uniref:DJ-1/PfpI domain-containing protein n=1 Tax=Methanoculleus bourgensis TaxID=83986 RepID=A0A0X3BII0_9EURY|nr:DJ-1/PfpI family protein [Methanoculleus bourgensis]CVK31709.1 protein of unknown function [Methanoculleus bourgensis]
MEMSRIAVLITDMFEDIEYTKPAEAFRAAGHDLVHVGLSAGETVHGKKREDAGHHRPGRRRCIGGRV